MSSADVTRYPLRSSHRPSSYLIGGVSGIESRLHDIFPFLAALFPLAVHDRRGVVGLPRLEDVQHLVAEGALYTDAPGRTTRPGS